MALFGQDRPAAGLVEGGAALGDLLTGGPGKRAEAVYAEQFRKNAQAADSMWKARDSRARAIAREGLGAALSGAGYDPKLAPLLSGVLATSASPDLRRLGDFQDPADRAIDQQRQEALQLGDIPAYNRLTALREDKAYQPARVVQGNVLPDGVGLGDVAFDMQPLPQTAATIAQKQSAVDQGQQRTDAYVDKARRPPAPRPAAPRRMPVGELKFHVERLESELGRKLSHEELDDLATGNFHVTVPADALGSAAMPESREGFVSFDDIPDEARARLKEGVKTRFGNGTVWTLVRGQPTRVN